MYSERNNVYIKTLIKTNIRGGKIMVSLEMLFDAQRVLREVATVTPVIKADKIAENIYLKSENFQLTGSFKLRGAYYKISTLTPEEAAKGVIACSGRPGQSDSSDGPPQQRPISSALAILF